MKIILGFFVALFLSILLVPALIKYASSWKLIDAPDGRKSHVGLIPRVGGIGIAVSAVIPSILWATHDRVLLGFLVGAGLIVVFGVLDDRFDLDFKIKLLGQTAAAIAVTASGICAYHLPLFGLDAVPAYIAYPITVIFLLGVTNAFNLLDGLDGLAAGCAILSLAAMTIIGFSVGDGGEIVLISIAAIGGILGFLRYNTHPAIVFMGDAGSQFLGFSIGVLAIMLVERTQNAMSPATVLPLLGLPILDTLMVMLLRIRAGRSPFSPDRNHIHHKLLSLGLRHHQAVAVIYGVQALMVMSAYLLRFESDWAVLAAYFAICITCVLAYQVAQNRLSLVMRTADGVLESSRAQSGGWDVWVGRARAAAVQYVEWSTAGYLIIGAVVARDIPTDVSVLALGLAFATIATALVAKARATAMIRLSAYLAVIYMSYLGGISQDLGWVNSLEFNAWLTSVAASMAFVVIFMPKEQFQFSTLDFLIFLVVIGAVTIPVPDLDQEFVSRVLVRSLVLLYACEILLAVHSSRLGPVGLAATLSLVLIGGHMLF